MLFYNFLHEGLAVAFAIVAILIMGVGFATARAMNKTDSFVEQLGEADILNRMWFPLQDELTVVVETGRPRDGSDVGVVHRSGALQEGDPEDVLHGNAAIRQKSRACRLTRRERPGD